MSEFNLELSNKHDIWNILWLPIVFQINLYYLFVDYSKEIENIFVNVFLIYLTLDFIWIILKPCSVSAPKIILLHHIVTISGVALIPSVSGNIKYVICLTTLVEINTWIRILKHFITKYISKSFLLSILDTIFITSWILLRCILGPYVQFLLGMECYYNINFINLSLYFIGLVLNTLSLKWSYNILTHYYQKNE